MPGLDEDFGADAAAFLAQLVGDGKRFAATTVRRERGLGAKERHPRKAADKLHLVLKGVEDPKLDVAREMLLEGFARLPKLHKVRDATHSKPRLAAGAGAWHMVLRVLCSKQESGVVGGVWRQTLLAIGVAVCPFVRAGTPAGGCLTALVSSLGRT